MNERTVLTYYHKGVSIGVQVFDDGEARARLGYSDPSALFNALLAMLDDVKAAVDAAVAEVKGEDR